MEHLHRLELVLEPEEGIDLELTPARASSLGPYFQGVLMEEIDTSYAGFLHGKPFNPYATYVSLQADNALTWQVSTLNDEAYEHIVTPLLSLDMVTLKALGKNFRVTRRQLTGCELKSLTDLIQDGGPGKAKVRFVTPTSFKSGGEYVFVPSVRLVFQNLLMHYFYVYEGSNEVDEETLDYLVAHTRITSFNIHSQYFDHAMGKGRRLPAFVGTLGLSARGPGQLVGLFRMLLVFGEYAGVGIKTSMGMGGMKCL